jgi:hypothetical protein
MPRFPPVEAVWHCRIWRRLNPALSDASGKLWFFGGDGYDSTGAQGYLNDLWEFQP